jgi:phage tail-like protein
MIANGQAGYFYLNAANAWPSFVFTSIHVDSHGTMRLAKTPGGYTTAGVFMGGPFDVKPGPVAWFRLGAIADELSENTHIQLFTFTNDTGTPPYFPLTTTPFNGWSPIPRDRLQAVIPNATARRLWLGGVMRSDGTSTPSLHQIRVDYGRETYLDHMPAIYRRNDASRDFLERFLALAQSGIGVVQREINDLPQLFDSDAAPASGFPSWLAWLCGWLAWQINEHWTHAQTRDSLADAFSLYGERGTVRGLRRYLKIYAGVNAHIFEPAQHATLWSLGENSTLGFTTMLAPSAAQGAVLGASAVLDRSSLADPNARFGGVLFSDIAHRFCVLIYCAQLTRPGALQAARAVVEREKPAHTVCDVCVIDAAMRVGSQASVGVDAIVGSEPLAQVGRRLAHVVLATKDRECMETGI